ncbi:MAG: amino acid ABC transporter permease [Planctomycetota bacterium]|jgi:polar amino acid transport system permease protein
MARSKSILVRAAITLAVAGLLAAALASSTYKWQFGKTWDYRTLFVKGMGVTLGATALAYLIGLALGVVVALARRSRHLAIRHVGDLYVEVVRGTPALVQITIAYFGLAPLLRIDNKFLVGAVALGIFAAAYIGEIFRAGIESIDRGQFEAARSLGLSQKQTMRHIIFPQAFKRMIPPLTGEAIALTKESSLLFYIGVVEMMSVAQQIGADTYRTFEALIIVAGLYLVITIPLSLLARRLERKLGKSEHLGAHL